MLRISVLGFLPFGRRCVVPFPGCDFQRLSALVLRQSTGLRVDFRTEKRDPMIPGQAATTLGALGGRLADSAPGGFVQRGMRCLASDGGHDGDLDRKSVESGKRGSVSVDHGGRRILKKKTT